MLKKNEVQMDVVGHAEIYDITINRTRREIWLTDISDAMESRLSHRQRYAPHQLRNRPCQKTGVDTEHDLHRARLSPKTTPAMLVTYQLVNHRVRSDDKKFRIHGE